MPLVNIDDKDMAAWVKHIPRGCLVNREDAIVDLCRGKTVLHLGAADSPFHRQKGADNALLHQKVRAVAAGIVGIDADKEAVECLRAECGIDDILVGDACTAAGEVEELRGRLFDVVLCCDIIEHVSNVSALLGTCKSFLAPSGVVVISTINATSLKAAVRAVFGREAVCPGHNAYYSFATLCQTAAANGLRPIAVGAFCYPAVTRLSRIVFGAIAKCAPGTADGIIITCGHTKEELPRSPS